MKDLLEFCRNEIRKNKFEVNSYEIVYFKMHAISYLLLQYKITYVLLSKKSSKGQLIPKGN